MAGRAPCLMLLILCSLHYIRGQTIRLAFATTPPVDESVGTTQVCMRVVTASGPVTSVTVQITAEEAVSNPAGSEDFSPPSAMLLFPNAATNDEECFNVTITEDEVVEANEDVRYVATTATAGVTFSSLSIEFLIDDNDLPTFSVANTSLTIMENAGTVMICANLTGPSGGLERSEDAQFLAVPGTALTPQDFNISPNPPLRVTFQSGTMVGESACGVVDIENNFDVDGNKQFEMMLEENSAYMRQAPLTTAVTIEDDEIPTLNITSVPVSVHEGTAFDACVTIDAFPSIPVTVTIGISGDTNDEDFNVPSTDVVLDMVFENCVTISVETDNLFEGDEPFSIAILSASVPAVIANPTMSIVIDAENVTVGFVELQQSFPEDSSTTTVCVEMVNLPSAGTNVSVVVFIDAVNTTNERCNIEGYARTPEDYSIGTNVTFPITAGNPAEECIDIFIVDDTFAEVNETFQLEISSTSPSNVILQNTTTEITILDDDVVTFSIPVMGSVVESDETFSLVVNISGPATNLERDVNITVEDFPDTAIEPDDYNFSPLTLSFLCSDNRELSLEDVELVAVTIENDLFLEDNETFSLNISASATDNVIIESNEITVTIIDDEFTARFTLTETTFTEGIANVLELQFVVIEGTPARETVINITIVEETVTSDDYFLVTPTITLGPETLQATVTIIIINDIFTEQDEFMQVIASSSDLSVDIVNNTVNVTIDSNNISTVFLNSSVNVTEGEVIQVCVNVEGSPLGQDLYVQLVLNETTTASFGDDFVLNGSLNFRVSAFTTATCEDLFTTLTDEFFEATESVVVSILMDSLEDVMAGDPRDISIDIINTNVFAISIEPTMLTISEMNGSTTIDANVTIAPNDVLAVDVLLTLGFAMSEAEVIEDFVVNMEEFLFSNGTLYMPGSAMSIMVNAVDNEVLEGNQDIVFNLITDVSLLPGLSVTIVNDTIEIIDDEVIMIQFVQDIFNFTEGEDQMVAVCFAPVQIPLGGYSIPIEVSVSVVSSSLDSDNCSGSGLASSSDFIVTSSSMFTFPPNSTTELCLMIDISDDNLTESHETFSVQINVLSFADNVFAGNSSVVTIYDNDNITVIVSSNSVDVDEDIGTVSIYSELSAGRLCTKTSIDVIASDGNATSPDDYVFELSNITYFPGFTVGSSSHVDVIIIDDMEVESNEHFTITLVSNNPSVETVSSSDTTTVNIIENDAAVRFANDTLFVRENDVVSVCAEIFDGQLLAPAVVHINFTNITTSIEDFSYSTKYFSFDSNTIIDCIDLSITADMIKENPENFSLTLFETEDTVVVSEDVLNITIISDDVAIISFLNDTRIYVEESIIEITLCVELTGAALSQDLTIQLMEENGPVAFAWQDFLLPTPFEVTFAAGSSIGSQDCITIGILDDDAAEGTHNFSVSMVDPGNPLCTLGSPSEIEIAIMDNEIVGVTLGTAALTITEGGMSSNLFVLLEVPSGGIEIDVSVTVFVTPLTGEVEDITLSSETVIFTPSIAPAMLPIAVTAVDDGFIEMDVEDVLVSIDNVSVSFRTGEPNETTISVVNINGAGIAFTTASQSVDEDDGIISVCAVIVFDADSTLLEDEVNVTLRFMEGSATDGQDYLVVNDTIVFSAMSLSNDQECAMVEIIDDQLFEDLSELFDVSFDNISISEVVAVTPTQQQITIVDNDIASFEVAQDISVLEDAGFVSVCVTLNGPEEGLAIDVTLNADSMDESAVAGPEDDYISVSMQSLTFPAESNVSNSQCVEITINDDFGIEGNETFQLTVADGNTRTMIEPATSVVTIIDNDLQIMFLNDSMVLSFAEMEAPIFTICFEVIQGMPSMDNLIFLTPDSLATAIMGSDYDINENPFIINSTVLNGCIDVEVLDDNFFENDDFVSFTLTSPTNGVQIVNGFLNITIENDDFPEFEFNNTKYIVNETSDTQVCVRTLPGGARVGPDVPTTVVLTIRNRTAIEGTDFSFDSGFELLFDGMSSVLCVPINIFDDGLVEFSEYFLVSFDHQGSTDEVEVVIHDPDVCPNVEAGPVCEDSIFLRVCNTLREMNGSAPRPCDIILEEYRDLNYQP